MLETDGKLFVEDLDRSNTTESKHLSSDSSDVGRNDLIDEYDQNDDLKRQTVFESQEYKELLRMYESVSFELATLRISNETSKAVQGYISESAQRSEGFIQSSFIMISTFYNIDIISMFFTIFIMIIISLFYCHCCFHFYCHHRHGGRC